MNIASVHRGVELMKRNTFIEEYEDLVKRSGLIITWDAIEGLVLEELTTVADRRKLSAEEVLAISLTDLENNERSSSTFEA